MRPINVNILNMAIERLKVQDRVKILKFKLNPSTQSWQICLSSLGTDAYSIFCYIMLFI